MAPFVIFHILKSLCDYLAELLFTPCAFMVSLYEFISNLVTYPTSFFLTFYNPMLKYFLLWLKFVIFNVKLIPRWIIVSSNTNFAESKLDFLVFIIYRFIKLLKFFVFSLWLIVQEGLIWFVSVTRWFFVELVLIRFMLLFFL
jgi:hypothetical protein